MLVDNITKLAIITHIVVSCVIKQANATKSMGFIRIHGGSTIVTFVVSSLSHGFTSSAKTNSQKVTYFPLTENQVIHGIISPRLRKCSTIHENWPP